MEKEEYIEIQKDPRISRGALFGTIYEIATPLSGGSSCLQIYNGSRCGCRTNHVPMVAGSRSTSKFLWSLVMPDYDIPEQNSYTDSIDSDEKEEDKDPQIIFTMISDTETKLNLTTSDESAGNGREYRRSLFIVWRNVAEMREDKCHELLALFDEQDSDPAAWGIEESEEQLVYKDGRRLVYPQVFRDALLEVLDSEQVAKPQKKSVVALMVGLVSADISRWKSPPNKKTADSNGNADTQHIKGEKEVLDPPVKEAEKKPKFLPNDPIYPRSMGILLASLDKIAKTTEGAERKKERLLALCSEETNAENMYPWPTPNDSDVAHKGKQNRTYPIPFINAYLFLHETIGWSGGKQQLANIFDVNPGQPSLWRKRLDKHSTNASANDRQGRKQAQQIDQISQQLAAERKATEDLRRQLREKSARVRELETAEDGTSETEKAAQETKMFRLVSELKDAVGNVQSLQQQLDQSAAALKRSGDQVNNLTSQVDHLQRANADLTRQLEAAEPSANSVQTDAVTVQEEMQVTEAATAEKQNAAIEVVHVNETKSPQPDPEAIAAALEFIENAGNDLLEIVKELGKPHITAAVEALISMQIIRTYAPKGDTPKSKAHEHWDGVLDVVRDMTNALEQTGDPVLMAFGAELSNFIAEEDGRIKGGPTTTMKESEETEPAPNAETAASPIDQPIGSKATTEQLPSTSTTTDSEKPTIEQAPVRKERSRFAPTMEEQASLAPEERSRRERVMNLLVEQLQVPFTEYTQMLEVAATKALMRRSVVVVSERHERGLSDDDKSALFQYAKTEALPVILWEFNPRFESDSVVDYVREVLPAMLQAKKEGITGSSGLSETEASAKRVIEKVMKKKGTTFQETCTIATDHFENLVRWRARTIAANSSESYATCLDAGRVILRQLLENFDPENGYLLPYLDSGLTQYMCLNFNVSPNVVEAARK